MLTILCYTIIEVMNMNNIEKYLEYKLDTRFIKGKAMYHKIAENMIIVYRWNGEMAYEANYKCLPKLSSEQEEAYICEHFEIQEIKKEYYFFLEEEKEEYEYECVQLTYNEEKQVEILKMACSEEDRNIANIMIYDMHPIGIYQKDELVGICSVIKEDRYYDIGVLVHPLWRNKHIGRDLVKHMVHYIHEEKGISIYKVEKENMKSIKLAKGVGFRDVLEVTMYIL